MRCRIHPPLWHLLRIAILPAMLVLSGIATAETLRPVQGPLADREVNITNRATHAINELYVSPSNADQWGADRLGDDTLDPGQSRMIKLGRTKDCSFDILVLYDDQSREEQRAVNLCRVRQAVVDGKTAVIPEGALGPVHEITVADHTTRPVQQLYISPLDAPQWGDDRLAASALSVGEERKLTYRGACAVDLRVVFDNRAAEERRGVDLCANPALRISPGWTTADSGVHAVAN